MRLVLMKTMSFFMLLSSYNSNPKQQGKTLKQRYNISVTITIPLTVRFILTPCNMRIIKEN